jgi:ascorbate-specific PTS system EIIC-type component UlaA
MKAILQLTLFIFVFFVSATSQAAGDAAAGKSKAAYAPPVMDRKVSVRQICGRI